MSSFEIIALRKIMTGSIIAVLLFSSLSFVFTTQLSNEEQKEAETEFVVIDTDQGLSEEPELQDSTERSEDTEPQLQLENIIPRFPSLNMEELAPQNLTEDTKQEDSPQENTQQEDTQPDGEPHMSAGSEAPDDDYSGTVNSIGVAIYSGIELSDPLVSIDWGNLRPGGNKTIPCYIQNMGETAEFLTLQTDNWTPLSATEYITLTWDYDEQPLNINEVIQVNLTLDIAVTIQGISTFFFDITIIGSSYG